MAGKTISDNNSIYIVAPIVTSVGPSQHSRTSCPLSKIAISVAQYTLDGKLVKTEQSEDIGEMYAAWKLRVSKLNLDSSGNVFGVFQLGDHSPNDISPSLKETVSTFTIKK